METDVPRLNEAVLHLTRLDCLCRRTVPEWSFYNYFPRIRRIIDRLEQDCFSAADIHLPTVYMNGESLEDAYAATLIANTTHEDGIASPPYCKEYKEWRSWIVEVMVPVPRLIIKLSPSPEIFER